MQWNFGVSQSHYNETGLKKHVSIDIILKYKVQYESNDS